MKTLDLNNYGIQEMNAVEMREVDGGSPASCASGMSAMGRACVDAVKTAYGFVCGFFAF